MEILVLGLNHKTAPVEVREKLSVPAAQAPAFLERFGEDVFREKVLLSTCNRMEIYGVAENEHEAVRAAKNILADHAHLSLSSFEDKLYVLKQPDSVRHLFSVASGLDSMVIGETEITGQVKNAYLAAQGGHYTGKVLNNLFQRSLKVAKNLRTHTEIGAGRVSVASVAVDLAEKIFESLKGARVMVIGTGEMAVQVLRAMTSRGAWPLIVSSHHEERAQALVGEFGGAAIRFDVFESHIDEVDILIASTTSSSCLVTAPQVRDWMKRRRGRPLFLVDIAMPRNIEGDVEKIDNVYLYNIDNLKDIADKNKVLRENQLEQCLRLVGAQTEYFMGWLGKEFGGLGSRMRP